MNGTTVSRCTRAILGVVLLLMFCAGTALAQRLDGTLRGTVSDDSGAVVVGAQVTALKEGAGTSQTTTTSSSGSYEFPDLLVGKYTVTIDSKGFQKYVRKDVDVRSNQVT